MFKCRYPYDFYVTRFRTKFCQLQKVPYEKYHLQDISSEIEYINLSVEEADPYFGIHNLGINFSKK